MVKKLNILGLRFKFVFRHILETEEPGSYINYTMWKTKRLGIWFKTDQIVMKPVDGFVTLGKDAKTSTSYMFGFDLILCKFWIDICYRPATFEI